MIYTVGTILPNMYVESPTLFVGIPINKKERKKRKRKINNKMNG